MINGIVSKVLSRLLSRYIDRIDSSQLEVQIWNGVATLNNVSINQEALSYHDIPATVKKGTVGSIYLNFPWGKLKTEPCIIHIKDIYIVAEVTGNVLVRKDLRLSKKIEETEEKEEVSESGIMSSILNSVIDNMQFDIKNVHIRIEIPQNDNFFAVDLTIKEISAYTVDEIFEKAFIADKISILRKKIDVSGVSFYIDTSTTPIDITHFNERMESEIYASHQYILEPLSCSAILMHDKVNQTEYKNQLVVSVPSIGLSLDAHQWNVIQILQKMEKKFMIRLSLAQCGRPNRYPVTYRSTQKWWGYVHRCIITNQQKHIFNPEKALQFLSSRKTYLELMESKNKMEPAEYEKSKLKKQIKEMENTLEQDDITFLRAYAERQLENVDDGISKDLTAAEIINIKENEPQNSLSGPYNVVLSIKEFSVSLFTAESKTLANFCTQGFELKITKDGLNTNTNLTIQKLALVNGMNNWFPNTIETSDGATTISYNSTVNMPTHIHAHFPTLLIVVDLGFFVSFLKFFGIKKGKAQKSTLVPATINEIKAAIKSHIAPVLEIYMENGIVKLPYEEIIDMPVLQVNFSKMKMESIENKEFSVDDYSTLYDSFNISLKQAQASIENKAITKHFDASVLIKNSLVGSDKFPELIVIVDAEPVVLNITTFQYQLLIEMILYIVDTYYDIKTPVFGYSPEDRIIINIPKVHLNVFYEIEHIFYLTLDKFGLIISVVDDDVSFKVTTSNIVGYEFFSGESKWFLSASSTKEDLYGFINFPDTRRFITIYLGNLDVIAKPQIISSIITFFRFDKDYEERLLLKEKAEKRNIWHVSKDDSFTYITIKILADQSQVQMIPKNKTEELGIIYFDGLEAITYYEQFGYDFIVNVTHPIIRTSQVEGWRTILDADMVEANLHSFNYNFYIKNLKFVLSYLWFRRMLTYFSDLISYGKVDITAPTSMMFVEYEAKIDGLELDLVKPGEASMHITSTKALLTTPRMPDQMIIDFDDFIVYDKNHKFAESPNTKFVLDFYFAKIIDPLNQEALSLEETKEYLKQKHTKEELYAIDLYMMGIDFYIIFDYLTIYYTEKSMKTFKKSLFTLFDYEGPLGTYELNPFKFELTAQKGVLKFPCIDVRLENFIYQYTDRQKVFVNGIDTQCSLYPINIFQNYDNSVPYAIVEYDGETLKIDFGKIGLYVYPQITLKTIFAIMFCPLYYDDEPPDPDNPPQVEGSMVFDIQSSSMNIIIPNDYQIDPLNLHLSFKFIWGVEQIWVQVNECDAAFGKQPKIIEPTSFSFKATENHGHRIQTSTFAEMRINLNTYDILSLYSVYNKLKNEEMSLGDSSTDSKPTLLDSIEILTEQITFNICYSQESTDKKLPFLKYIIMPTQFAMNAVEAGYHTFFTSESMMMQYNLITGKWDSIIDSCCFNITIDTSKDHHNRNINFSIPKEININLPASIFGQAQEFMNQLQEFNQNIQHVIESAPQEAYVIENRMGTDIILYLNNKIHVIRKDKQIRLPIDAYHYIGVSFGDSMKQVAQFTIASICYPTFIHQKCVVNSEANKHDRLITISSPIKMKNFASVDLEIYFRNKKNSEFIQIGFMAAGGVMHIPYYVDFDSQFIFKEKNVPMNTKHKRFTHKTWNEYGIPLKVLTEIGPLSCVIRHNVDLSTSIGSVTVYPTYRIFNETTSMIEVELVEKHFSLKIESGKSKDVPYIRFSAASINIRVIVDGYQPSKIYTIMLQASTIKPHIIDIGDIHLASFLEKNQQTGQSLLYIFSPTVLFNQFSTPLIIKDPDTNEEYPIDMNESLMYGSSSFFKKGECNALIQCPGISINSDDIIDFTASGINSIYYLPHIAKNDYYIPIQVKVQDANAPFTHSTIGVISAALSINNECNNDFYIIPTNAPSDIQPIMVEAHTKHNIMLTNKEFSFKVFIDPLVRSEVILSSPLKTNFRLNDNIFEIEIVEDGWGLCAHFRKVRFPTTICITNYLENESFTASQIQKQPFVFLPMTTSIFAFDDPFGRQSIAITLRDRTIFVSVVEDSDPVQFDNTDLLIEMRTVGKGNRLLIISSEPIVQKRNNINVNVAIHGLTVSFIDSSFRELFLFTFGDLNFVFKTTDKNHLLELTLDFVQIDDQCAHAALPVALTGMSNKGHKFLYFSAVSIRDAPLFLSFKFFSLMIQEIQVFADYAFISDALTFLYSIFKSKVYQEKLVAPEKPKEMTTIGRIYSFAQFEIHPIKIVMNYRGMTGRPTTIPENPELPLTKLKYLVNITNAIVKLNCIMLTNFHASLPFIQRNIVSQYQNTLMNQIWSLIGHTDIIFNPVGFIDAMGTGVKNNFYDPQDGVEESPEAAMKRIAIGSKNMAQIAIGSVLQSGEGFVRGISSLVTIASFGASGVRAGGLNQTAADTIKDGFISLGTGIIDGISGVVMLPIEGAKKNGAAGMFEGLGKGLLGVVTKPIAGILDCGAGIVGGIRKIITMEGKIIERHRMPNAYLFNNISVYIPSVAEDQYTVQQIRFPDTYKNEKLCARINDEDHVHIFCLFTSYVFLINRKRKMPIPKNISLKRVVKIKRHGNKIKFYVEIPKKKYEFTCESEMMAEEIIVLMASRKNALEYFS